MRVAMVTTNLTMSGGIQKLVLRTAQDLVSRGCRVDILTFAYDPETCHPQILTGATIHTPRQNARVHDASRDLAKSIPEVDLVIIHDVGSMPVLANMRQETSRPHVLWMLNHEFTPTSFSLWRRVAIAVREAWQRRDMHARRAVMDAWRCARSTRSALTRVDHAATYDRANAHAVRRHLGLPARVVYAAADLDDFHDLRAARPAAAAAAAAAAARPFVILSVGVLLPYRRFEDLIRAVSLLNAGSRRFRLVIVGAETLSPGYAAFLRRLVLDLDIEDDVDMLGVVDDAHMKDLYGSADAFAFVNDGRTWGISVFEGLAAGLPVILTDNIGASDLLVDGQHALFVPPRDPRAIARALTTLAASPDRGRSIADDGYEAIATLLTWPAFVDRLVALAQDSGHGADPMTRGRS